VFFRRHVVRLKVKNCASWVDTSHKDNLNITLIPNNLADDRWNFRFLCALQMKRVTVRL
jgi:hypothetical protein